MKNDDRTRYLTRDRVLKLLSDNEIASVCTAESAARLEDGDEYLDLEALAQGVHGARGAATPMGRLLPRKAVQEETWGKILKELAGDEVATPHSGGLTDNAG